MMPRQAQNSSVFYFPQPPECWDDRHEPATSRYDTVYHKLRRLLYNETLHTQLRSLLRFRPSLLPPNKTAIQRRGKQKGEKFPSDILMSATASSLNPTLTPHRHLLFIGHSCLMNVFYEPFISIIISNETANFTQDSLLNVWLWTMPEIQEGGHCDE